MASSERSGPHSKPLSPVALRVLLQNWKHGLTCSSAKPSPKSYLRKIRTFEECFQVWPPLNTHPIGILENKRSWKGGS